MGIGMRPENKRASKVCGALAVEKRELARFRVRSRLKKSGKDLGALAVESERAGKV